MNRPRFFRSLWRINAVIIFLIGVGIVCVTGYALVSELVRHHGDTAAPPVAKDVKTQEELRFGAPFPVSNTRFVRIDLNATVPEVAMSSSERVQVRNLLTIDMLSGVARWLLPTHQQKIAEREDVGETNEAPIATVVRVAPLDDNGDDTLYVTDPSGEHVRQVATHVSSITGEVKSGASEISIIYESHGRYHCLKYDTAAFAAHGDHEIVIPAVASPSTTSKP